MTKIERLEFMRRRFRKKVPIQPLAVRQKPSLRTDQDYLKGIISISVNRHTKELPLKWVYSPVKAKDPNALPPRRIARKSYLVGIAEHYHFLKDLSHP